MAVQKTLQKISVFFGRISFIGAVICLAWLFFTREGASEVYIGSMGASAFFLFSAGVVLMTMGKANLPNLTPGNHDSTEEE
jgi:hypothetical protein